MLPDAASLGRRRAFRRYFPFKGIPRFYDIGGFLKDPEAFALVIEVLTERYKGSEITSICGLDARGFVLGPPLALALKKPFFMLRKKGKMPNAVTGEAYAKEYFSRRGSSEDESRRRRGRDADSPRRRVARLRYAGDDALAIPRGAVAPGDRVLASGCVRGWSRRRCGADRPPENSDRPLADSR